MKAAYIIKVLNYILVISVNLIVQADCVKFLLKCSVDRMTSV